LTAILLAVLPGLFAAPFASGDQPDIPPLDLAALLREAEANNPDLAAAASRRAAAETISSQVEAPPDPVVSVSYTNDTVTGLTLGDSEFTTLAFNWTQEIPYPGKLGRAADAARRDAEVSQRRLELTRAGIASRIKQAYADLYRLDRSVTILKENRLLLAVYGETARARYETGEGLLADVLKAQTEVIKLDADLENLAADRVTYGTALNILVGRSAGASLGPAWILPQVPDSVDAEELEREAAARAPEVLEMDAAVLRDQARLDLARLQVKPDLVWGAAYMNRGGLDPMVMGMFGLRLPLHENRKQTQGIVQAESELEAGRQGAAAARLKAGAEARDLASRAASAARLQRLYAEGIIPQAQLALESAAASYSVGRADFLTLLNGLIALSGYELEHETLKARRVSFLAALERLTGRDLVHPISGKESS
jgi:outer membrane protein TolC